MRKQKILAVAGLVIAGAMPFVSFAQMATGTTEIVQTLNSNISVAWAWALGIVGVLFLFALGTNALNSGLRVVLRQVRKIFRL